MCHSHWGCSPSNKASLKQLNESGILIKFGRGIVATASLHPSATVVFDKIEKEDREATAMYEDFLKRSGDI